MKLAFFDMDGTIAAPRYLDNGKPVIGFDAQGWINFCNETQPDAYAICEVIQPVIDFAKQLKEKGYTLYILTMSLSEAEEISKRNFVRQMKLDTIFNDILFTPNDDAKLIVMASCANKYHIPKEFCMLVEDTYSTLLKAHEAGFQAVHISNILTDTITC